MNDEIKIYISFKKILIFIILLATSIMAINLFNKTMNYLKNIKIEYHYIDFDNNEGIATYCNYKMSCRVNNKNILVKEYKIIKVNNNK